ncbi:hypothetical protein [Microbispora hainanensis]|uniref:hypothetical protein n=1 Tax=Microbispora hainanensis TaxID=568844 RepID=UPI0033D11275
MEIGPPPPHAMARPALPPPPTNIYMVPPPPVVVATQDSGSGARSAALICFILGFFTCGITWIPAIILAIVGASSSKTVVASHTPGGSYRPSRPRSNRTGVIIVSIIGAIVLTGVVTTAVTDATKHTVEVIISGSETQTFAGEAYISTKAENRSGTDVLLPHREILTVKGSLSTITVAVTDGYSGRGRKRKKASITCVIMVDGNVVDESTDDGECYASYSGSR